MTAAIAAERALAANPGLPATARPGVPRAVGGAGLRHDPGAAREGPVRLERMGGMLGETIKAAQAAGDPDTGETYYHHWLATLERMMAEKAVTTPADLARYRDAWERAAHRTPHGQPIELKSGDFTG